MRDGALRRGDRWMEGRSRPNRVVRQRSYARAEAKHLRGREQERVRSRSPVRSHGCRDEWPQDDRRRKTDEGMRCFACNEPGHRAVDCSIAQQSGGKACFRCGETGHIARACRVHIDEARTEAEVAAGDSDSGFNGNYGNDRGDDNRWSPPHRATADGHASANKREPQEQSSVLPSCAGYYVEDEVDWGDGDGHVRQAKYEKSHQPHVHPQREFMVREPYLGLPHLKNANIDNVPPTVQDLRGYDYRIKFMYESKPKTQRFVNGGNGKVAPARYGSEQRHDLGLCFATFLTRKRCEMGVRCPWRHHPLSNAEKAWIVEYGKKKGKEFIDNVDRWWSFPEVPVPGATMHGLGDKDT